MKTFLRTLGVFLGVAIAAIAGYYFVIVLPLNAAPPPAIGEMKDFTLTDTEGREFSSAELKGKVWVADLIFTSCPMTCPMMTRKMKNIYLSYELEDKVRFVSVSVDPKTDTPAVLKAFAGKNEIDTSKWHFLTGEFDLIRDVAVNGFKLVATDDPSLHSDRFVLIDADSRVRGYYDPKEKSEMRRLFHELALVLREEGDRS